MQRKSTPFLYLVILIALLFSGCATVTTKSESPIDTFIRTGFITKISVPSNEVWINEYQWSLLTVTQKENFIYLMSDYFKRKRGYERVTVYGGHSARKLAKTGLIGIKFY